MQPKDKFTWRQDQASAWVRSINNTFKPLTFDSDSTQSLDKDKPEQFSLGAKKNDQKGLLVYTPQGYGKIIETKDAKGNYVVKVGGEEQKFAFAEVFF
jgi:hypothetical protein